MHGGARECPLRPPGCDLATTCVRPAAARERKHWSRSPLSSLFSGPVSSRVAAAPRDGLHYKSLRNCSLVKPAHRTIVPIARTFVKPVREFSLIGPRLQARRHHDHHDHHEGDTLLRPSGAPTAGPLARLARGKTTRAGRPLPERGDCGGLVFEVTRTAEVCPPRGPAAGRADRGALGRARAWRAPRIMHGGAGECPVSLFGIRAAPATAGASSAHPPDAPCSRPPSLRPMTSSSAIDVSTKIFEVEGFGLLGSVSPLRRPLLLKSVAGLVQVPFCDPSS